MKNKGYLSIVFLCVFIVSCSQDTPDIIEKISNNQDINTLMDGQKLQNTLDSKDVDDISGPGEIIQNSDGTQTIVADNNIEEGNQDNIAIPPNDTIEFIGTIIENSDGTQILSAE